MATRYWIATGTASASWTNTANWAGGNVPVTGDSAYIQNSASAIDIVSGLNQSGVLLAQLIIDQSFTGSIGSGTNALQIGATYIRIGDPAPDLSVSADGSGRIILDTGTNVTTIELVSSATSTDDTGLPPVRWIGNNASNVIAVMGGSIGIAVNTPAETATLGQWFNGGGNLFMGPGVTWSNGSNTAGLTDIQKGGNTATLNIFGGEVTTRGIMTIGTLTMVAGTFNFLHRASSGTSISTINLQGGTFDARADGRAFSASTFSFRGGSIYLAYNTQATFTTTSIDFAGKTDPSATLS